MALDFPASPSVGQTYTGPGGIFWQWDGVKWVNGAGVAAYAPVESPAFTGNPTAPQPPTGDADTSIATTAFVQAAIAPSSHNIGRNLLHNSLFAIWQRGFGPFTTQGYTADRWIHFVLNDTVSAATAGFNDAQRAQIGDEEARAAYSNIFTGNAAAGSFNMVQQRIEGVRRLAGKTVTVSFWAGRTAGSASRLGVSIDQIFGTGGSPSANVLGNGVAVPISAVMTRCSATFTVPSMAGKVIGTNADDSTDVGIWYSSGATNAVRAGNIGVQSGAVVLWGVQLEVGNIATPLEKPDPRYDMSNCQRFYQTGQIGLSGYTAPGAGCNVTLPFPVTMRATPVMTPTFTTQTNCGSSAVNPIGAAFFQPSTVGTAAGDFQLVGTFTASADL